MTRLPRITGREIVAALRKAGFEVARIKGSHHFLRHADGRGTVVPVHAGETIGPGLLAANGDSGLAPERRLPDDPVGFIQDRVRRERVLWTYHVNMRLAGRFIPREIILAAVASYELVEAYPDDKYLPSYLILGRHGPEAFHVLFATDLEGDNVRVVASYRPDPEEWQADLKARRPNR